MVWFEVLQLSYLDASRGSEIIVDNVTCVPCVRRLKYKYLCLAIRQSPVLDTSRHNTQLSRR